MPRRTVPRAARQTDSTTTALLRPFLIVGVIVVSSVLFALTLLPSVGAAGHAVKRFSDQFNEIGKVDDLTFPRFPERSTIYAADGSVLATLFFDENRKYVKLGQINDIAQKAVLAIEDTKFYEHKGVDTRAVIRAAIANFTAGGVEQGASTVTQQLARNAFPAIGTERTLERKIVEARVAMRLEREYSKKQILELYLNRVYFGRGVYGIGTAAEYYFGKSAKDLSLGEAATLAGVIAAPEKYSPETNPEAATNRRNQVLARLAAVGWITQEEADATAASPIELKLTPPTKTRAPFFVDFIKRRILEDNRFGKTREARKQTLFQGGLKIHTTLEPKLERQGKEIVRKHLPDGDDPEAAIASIDAKTGAIKALVSSQSFDKSQVNLATGEGGTGRQVGSSFKPFTLVAALEQGVPQMKVYNGASGQVVDECNPPYRVNNSDGSGSYMNLWQATENSVNAVFVRLAVDAGLEKLVEVAHRMGIKSKLNPYCSLTLGTSEVNALEMANGFQTLANEGKRCEPFAIRDVKFASGKTLPGFPQKKGSCKQVVDKKIAITVVNMLKRVVTSGTGTAANLGQWPVFGKTGSTNDLKDATFGGCTRQVCSFVWVGHQKALIPMRNVNGVASVFGGTFPARIWHDFMAVAMKGKKAQDWPPAPKPESAVVPDVLGKTREQAEKILAEAGFTAQAKDVPSLDVEVGKVAEQSPGGGSKTTAGSIVNIGISNGKAPKGKIPNVVGLKEGPAVKQLQKAGFNVAVSYQPASNKTLDGVVDQQMPGGGTKAKEGSTVTIVVWKYTKPSPSPSPTASPAGGGGPPGG